MIQEINILKNQAKMCPIQSNINQTLILSDFCLEKNCLNLFSNLILHTDIITVFILKYYLNMDLIDTPNPSAKKILIEHSYEIATYIKKDSQNIEGIAKDLIQIDGILSIFTGPGFLTITKEESSDWNVINNDILNKFDTI